MATKKTAQPDNLQELESALTKTEHFIEDNQKVIMYVVGGILLIVAGYLSFNRFYLAPKEKDAQSQMFMAQNYFEKDSFNLALNGDGNYLGFLDIIDDYGITKSANTAKYYAGISLLHLGKYNEALGYLKKFKTDDLLLKPVKEGAIGDCYNELGDKKAALSHYKSAYETNVNELTSPFYMMKAGSIYESNKEYAKALELYNTIKEKYPNSNEGASIDKYIARVNGVK